MLFYASGVYYFLLLSIIFCYIVWKQCKLFVHFLVDGHKFLTITYKTNLNNYLFVRTDAFIILEEIYRNNIVALYGKYELNYIFLKRPYYFPYGWCVIAYCIIVRVNFINYI